MTAVSVKGLTRDERLDAWASLRMIADAVGELFGPLASIESEDASLLRGPEFHHFAQGIVEALQRLSSIIPATKGGEPVAFIAEKLDGSKRSIMLASKYDPRKAEFWVNDVVRQKYRIIPLFASPAVAPGEVS